MATKQNSKRSTRKPLPTIKSAEPTEKEFAAFGRKVWLLQAEADRAEATRLAQQEHEAQERAKAEAAGITLKGPRLEQARKVLAAIVANADAVRELSVSAICNSPSGEHVSMLVGIESMAVVVARKCDVLAELVGDHGFGYCADEFEVVPETAGAENADA